MDSFKTTSATLNLNAEPFMFNLEEQRIVDDFEEYRHRTPSFNHCDIEALINEYKSEDDGWNGFADSYQLKDVNQQGKSHSYTTFIIGLVEVSKKQPRLHLFTWNLKS